MFVSFRGSNTDLVFDKACADAALCDLLGSLTSDNLEKVVLSRPATRPTEKRVFLNKNYM